MHSTNNYCKDVALICIGKDCYIQHSKIFCGYDQTTHYCEFVKFAPGGKLRSCPDDISVLFLCFLEIKQHPYNHKNIAACNPKHKYINMHNISNQLMSIHCMHVNWL